MVLGKIFEHMGKLQEVGENYRMLFENLKRKERCGYVFGGGER
jgi:hypothetical protein